MLNILQDMVKRSIRVVAIAAAAVFMTAGVVVIIFISPSTHPVSPLRASNQLMYMKAD